MEDRTGIGFGFGLRDTHVQKRFRTLSIERFEPRAVLDGDAVVDLAIHISDGREIYQPATAAVETIVVTNAGPATAAAARVRNPVPPQLSGTTWTATYSPGATGPSSGSGGLDATVTLPAGGAAIFTVVSTVASQATGALSSTATVEAGAGTIDANPSDNTSTDVDKLPSIVFGSAVGYESTPRVSVVDPFTGSVRASWLAFEEGFRGGVNAILVDFDGDGVDEVAVASGSGRVAEVRFFDLQGNSLAGYPALVPFGERYDGGLNLASGDLDADGDGDLVVAKAHGAGDVQIHESRPGAPVKLVELTAKAFRPFPDKFQAGATIAVGDLGTFSGGSLLNAAAPDGRGEIIIGNGPGSDAVVLVYDISNTGISGTPRQADRIVPFSPAMRGGVAVSAGRFNADAIDDIFIAGGRGAGSVTEIYDGTVAAAANTRLARQAAFGSLSQSSAPVFAAGLDIDGDNRVDQLFATQGLGGGGHGIRRIAANGSLQPLFTTFTGQMRPAASTRPADESLVTTSTGLQYRDTKIGGGAVARTGQTVRVHYVGSSRNGTVFDSSRDVRPGRTGSPFEFKLGNKDVIAGWDEGVAGMRVGGRRTLVIPANLAYEGQSGRPQGTLVFDVELISVG